MLALPSFLLPPPLPPGMQVSLGAEGLIPLETRFLHDPAKPVGFVGAALSSNVIHFTLVSGTACLSNLQPQVARPG